jgi:hypothetical protein
MKLKLRPHRAPAAAYLASPGAAIARAGVLKSTETAVSGTSDHFDLIADASTVYIAARSA